MESKLVFFDLETGGLNPERHPILQIGAIAIDGKMNPQEAIELKIQFDEMKANRQSLRKSHYHRGVWVKEGVSAEDGAKRFAEFLRRHATVPVVGSDGATYHIAQLAAHNASFDGPFLQAWYAKRYMYFPARFQILCTLQRAQWFFEENPLEIRPRDYKLPTLCQYFKVPFDAAAAHDALGDATATAGLYRAIRDRIHVSKAFQTLATVSPLAEAGPFSGSRPDWAGRGDARNGSKGL